MPIHNLKLLICYLFHLPMRENNGWFARIQKKKKLNQVLYEKREVIPHFSFKKVLPMQECIFDRISRQKI